MGRIANWALIVLLALPVLGVLLGKRTSGIEIADGILCAVVAVAVFLRVRIAYVAVIAMATISGAAALVRHEYLSALVAIVPIALAIYVRSKLQVREPPPAVTEVIPAAPPAQWQDLKLKEETRKMESSESRDWFMAVALFEQLQLIEPVLDDVAIAERLGTVWRDIQPDIAKKAFVLDADCVLALNGRIAKALDSEPGEFRDRAGWIKFVEECGPYEDDSNHVPNWIFAELYWKHVTRFRLATVWIFINALKQQRGEPLNRLSVPRLGDFLNSLSGAGPPISDGQTFFAQDYS